MESRDDDGWIQEGGGEPSSLSYQDGGGRRLPFLDRVKQEQLSEGEEDGYSSPKIIPDSARSIASQNMVDVGRYNPEVDSTYTLRKLLEKPPVNASAELRLNAAELKERGVVINPAISFEVERNLHVHLPSRDSPAAKAKEQRRKTDQPPSSFALESLIRMALLAKEDEEVSRETIGGQSRSEKELLENQGISMGSFQRSLFQIPQAFRNGNTSSVERSGSTASSMTDAPSLKSILRGRDAVNQRSEQEEKDVSVSIKMEDEPHENSFGMASAAYALQHLAQMQDPQQTYSGLKAGGAQRMPKAVYQKRHKHDKQRRRHRSGSRKKCDNNPLPTVKYLLEKKREGLPLSKYRVRLKSRKDADLRGKSHHYGGGDHHGHKGRRNRGLQDSPIKRNSRKRSKVTRKQPSKQIAKPTVPSSPPPSAIDISTSASQMMKLIAEQENTPSMYSSAPVVRSHSKSGDGASPASGFKNNGTSPSPRPKSGGGSPSLNNSASEVMKLLASKNQERNNLILDSLPTVPLKPVSPPPPPPSSRLSDMSPPAPASQHPPQRPPPTSDEFGKSMIGAADIMKQLASSYSQNSPHRLQYPLSLMFVNPPAADSSSAFSLMKELITKGSS